VRFIYRSSKIFLGLVILFSSAAFGYTPQFADEANSVRLRWKNSTIKIALSNSLTKQNPNIKPGSDVTGAIQKSFETWENAAGVKFQISWTDKQTLSPAGNAGDSVSLVTIAATAENLLFFGYDSYETSARTRTFFNRKGFITEADIVLNPYQQFSTDGSIGTFDLQAVLTHEIGHLLGLDHSFIVGATMNEHQGKNGIYNLPAFNARTLAADDIAGIRALYGAGETDETCCGTINGKLSFFGGKAAKNFQVWAQDTTGRVIAGMTTNADGSFRIESLPAGEYQIYSQKTGEKAGSSFPSRNIGEIEVQNGKAVEFVRKLPAKTGDSNLQYLGFNGQISSLAVGVNGGKSYVLYLGGKNFDLSETEVFFESPYITVTPNTFIKHDYGAEVSVISFEIKVGADAPAGEYGIFMRNRAGFTECLAGSLIIDTFENPWSSSILMGRD
jgi:Matrixin/Carboxypeptidase regulatory-like domain